MKKGFFYFAMAAFAVFGLASCGDDDEFVKPDNSDIVIPEPESSSQAADYHFTGSGMSSEDGNAKLMGLTITESGKAVADIITPEGEKFVSFDTKMENGLISLFDEKGNFIGTIQEVSTKSQATVSLIVDIEIYINGKTYTFQIKDGNAVTVLKFLNEATGGQLLTNLARTWNVKSMFLTLSGDVDLSKYEESGNMEVFVAEARKRDAGLTPTEEAQLSKVIKSFSADKNGNLFIEYVEKDGTHLTEAAKWYWNASMTGIVIKFRDTAMGNKFMSDNSQIDLEFNASGGLTLGLNTDIKGTKNYHANLIVVLKE